MWRVSESFPGSLLACTLAFGLGAVTAACSSAVTGSATAVNQRSAAPATSSASTGNDSDLTTAQVASIQAQIDALKTALAGSAALPASGADLVTTIANLQAQITALIGNSAAKTDLATQVAALAALVTEANATKAITDARKYLRIIDTGDNNSVGAVSVQVANAVNLRAALFDANGIYLSDQAVVWSLTDVTFPKANLNPSTSAAATAVFTPTQLGTTFVRADYQATDASIVGRSALTGLVTVTSNQVATTFTVQDGNNQSGTAGQTLSQPLRIKVLGAFSEPVVGISVQFSVSAGGGSLTGNNPTLTDVNGVAAINLTTGTTVGANLVHAKLVSNNALSADFTATGTPGPPASIAFTTQPAGAYDSQSFLTQPIVTVKDQFGNTSPVSGTVTLTLQSGTGSLTGTLTANAIGGVATFANVGYSKAENGIVVHAAYPGSLTVNSGAFNVATVPGKCQTNDSAFTSLGGGCKDLTTNLVWSGLSSGNYTWYDAVWDSTFAGNAGTQDSGDYGRTNDYPVAATACGGNCDNSSVNYCHDLVQGGQSDWRLPSLADLQTMQADAVAGAGATAYLAGAGNFNVQASDTYTTTTSNYFYNISTNTTGNGAKSTQRAVYCVRGGRSAANLLIVTAGDASPLVNVAYMSVTLQVRDGLNNNVNAANLPITLSTNLGTIGGTTSGWVTDNTGQVVVNGFSLSTAGLATLTLASSGLTSANFAATVASSFPHECVTNDTSFATWDGGCKDLLTGKVWSLANFGGISWYDAVWGGLNSPSGNVGPKPSDIAAGRTNDYDPGTGSNGVGGYGSGTDVSTVNYCHDLSEGGHTDWRLPMEGELLAANGDGAGSHFNFNGDVPFWSSSSYSGTEAWAVYLSNPTIGHGVKAGANSVVCVRP